MDKLIKDLRYKREGIMDRREGNHWGVYNSPIDDYEKTFKEVLQGNHIVDLLKDRPDPVVVDLMSQTDGLVSLFNQLPQLNKLGVAVSITEDRSKAKIIRDEKLRIKHVTGDLNRPKTWKALDKELLGRKVDLTMERGGLGVAWIPSNEKFFLYAFNRIWENTSENNGRILVQANTQYMLNQTGIRFREWFELLNSNHIEAILDEGNEELGDLAIPTLQLIRNPKSPKSLPTLEEI